MSRVSIYLNFMGKTEEAFNFYKKVFGTEFTGPFQRMSEVLKDSQKVVGLRCRSPICSGEATLAI